MVNSIVKLLYISSILLLLYSSFVSGFNYTWNVDEIYHSQISYLISKGYMPYKDFLHIFPPFYAIFTLPLFLIIGPNLDAIVLSRLLMIFIFSLKIIFSFSIVRILFGKTASIFFLPLYLLDPITIFSSMQIRPDNLGLFFLTLALITLLKKKYSLSGIILFFAFISSTKILPTLGIIFLFAIFNIRQHYKIFVTFIPCLLIFILLFVFNNSFKEMFDNIFIYPKMVAQDGILFPPPLGNFFLPDNAYIYGSPGKPATWMYLWTLPLLAGAGIFNVINKKKASYVEYILVFSLILEFLSLFFIRAVFSQYFVSLNWFYAIFASVALGEVFEKLKETKWKKLAVSFVIILLIVLTKSAFFANLSRSKISFKENVNSLSQRFSQIPFNEYVFPNILFHPPVYPLTAGAFMGDIPKAILDTYPPVEKTLEDKKVKYLLLSDYYLSYLKPNTVNYIKNNYNRILTDPELWLRK